MDYIANSCWSRHFYFLSFLINQSLWLFEKVTFKIPNEYDRQDFLTPNSCINMISTFSLMKRGKNSSLWWTLWQIVQRMTITKICPLKIHTVTFWVHVNHNYKKKSLSLIEFFVGIIIFNQVKSSHVWSKITQSKQKFDNPLIGL